MSQATNLPEGIDLHLEWTRLGNCRGKDKDCHEAKLSLTNLSSHDLPAKGWAIYFNGCRHFCEKSQANGTTEISRLNGDVYKLSPTDKFKGLKSGQTLHIDYMGKLWTLNKTDAPLGFFIVYDGFKPQMIGDPKAIKLQGATEQECKRNEGDRWPLSTAEYRFSENENLKEVKAGLITPKPLEEASNGTVDLDPTKAYILHDASLTGETKILVNYIKAATGVEIKVSMIPISGFCIKLGLGKVSPKSGLESEAYSLTVTKDGVDIQANNAQGIMHGITSLRHLFPPVSYINPCSTLQLPLVKVVDAPRFAHRGLHVDVGRNFQTKQTLLRILDVMSHLKLNVFHFHLTDDEGWRMEIPGLEELIELSSKRGWTKDMKEDTALLPSFASGDGQWGSPGTPSGSGFYTRQDVVDIIKYATERHIEVVPEFDIPGHARSAIKAMALREARLKAKGVANADEYSLHDPQDKSVYESVQGWNDNVMCIAREGVYNFIDKLFVETKKIWKEAGAKLRVVHTGGDEVPNGVWKESPMCQDLMKSKGFDLQGLFNWFQGRVRDIFKKHDLTFAGWEEIGMMVRANPKDGETHHMPNPAFADAGFLVYIWNSVYGWGQEDYAYQLANAGYDVVLCNVNSTYFDLAYSMDPEEPGYYWGGFLNIRDPFEWQPLDIFSSAKQSAFGVPLDPNGFGGKQRLTKQGLSHVKGVQAQLWAENLRSRERVEYLLLPRLVSFAERAWSSPDNADYDEFIARLGERLFPSFDGNLTGHEGGPLLYRLAPPGIKVKDGKVHLNTDVPALTIRYTTDGSEPNLFSKKYEGPFEAKGQVKAATFNLVNRRSRASIN